MYPIIQQSKLECFWVADFVRPDAGSVGEVFGH